MLIYKNNNKLYCYIHIPKNSGRHIRKTIINDTDNIVLKKYWGVISYFDEAHIPFMLKNDYISFLKEQDVSYYTYTRNPYNRIISAFFHNNLTSNIDNFKDWIRKELVTYDFNKSFDSNIIHYYPQYMFICNSDFEIKEVKFEKLEGNFPDIREYDLSKYFELDTIEIINKVYRKDFELFNYKIITEI